VISCNILLFKEIWKKLGHSIYVIFMRHDTNSVRLLIFDLNNLCKLQLIDIDIIVLNEKVSWMFMNKLWFRGKRWKLLINLRLLSFSKNTCFGNFEVKLGFKSKWKVFEIPLKIDQHVPRYKMIVNRIIFYQFFTNM
jgi:hypothetical protein